MIDKPTEKILNDFNLIKDWFIETDTIIDKTDDESFEKIKSSGKPVYEIINKYFIRGVRGNCNMNTSMGETHKKIMELIMKLNENIILGKFPNETDIEFRELIGCAHKFMSTDVGKQRFISKMASLDISKAIKHPGSLREHFGVSKGQKIPIKEARKKYNSLRKQAKDDDLNEHELSLLRKLSFFLNVLHPASKNKK